MDLQNLNNISSSKYEIYTKLLDLAASGEYITGLQDFENVDFLRSGLMGYVMESLAMIMRDSSFHKTMIYRENFLNSAIMPKSIYNWAKMFNINILDARPSLRYAEIKIDTETIDTIIQNTSGNISAYKIKYGISESSNFMVLDKINPIIAGDYYFALEHSIEIYKNAKGKYIVKYCLNEEDITTEFGSYTAGGTITTKYVSGEDGTKYLVFNVLVAQYRTVESSKIITGSSFIDTKVHEFEYSGQLCGMLLKYTKGNKTENVELKFSNIEIEDDMDDNKKVAYFNAKDNNIIEFSFLTNRLTGLPQTGGILTLKTFITEGYEGNISFNGDAVFLIKQDDFKSLPILVSLSSSIISSGINQTSLSNIKSAIVDKLSTRNTIITENDLNTWFATQSKLLENINNSIITFRKEKDNLLKRTFSAFLLLRDGVSLDTYLSGTEDITPVVSSSYISSVVPTNTVDVVIDKQSVDSGMVNELYEIDQGDTISYDIATETYRLSDSIGETDYNYRLPFTAQFNTKYNKVSFYHLDTDDSVNIEFNNLKYTNIAMIPTQLSVYSTYVGGDIGRTYTFKIWVTSDAELETKSLANLSLKFGASTITIKQTTSLYFQKVDSTSDDSSGLTNYVLSVTADYNGLKTASENVQINLEFEDGNGIDVYSESSVSIIFAFEDGTFDGSFMTTKPLKIFNPLDDVMSSDITLNYTIDNSTSPATKELTSYTLKNLPVVASYWYDSDVNKKWFIKQLFIFINMLKENTNKLETTTFFDIKFRNTYGMSKYFDTISTALRLSLVIYLNRDKIDAYKGNLTTGYDTYESLEREILDYIRVAVDSSNADGELVISKIIMKTQAAYYNFIDHIDFNGLNGTFNQHVGKINTTNTKYPLEYFSLDGTIEDDGISRLEKDITFVIQ